MMNRAACVALTAALAVACGGETDKSTGGTDTGATADGAASDAAGGSDATTGGDAATGSDATSGTDAGGTTDAGGKPKTHQTCPAVADCVLAACAPTGFKDGCSDACLADAADAALAKGGPLLACAQKTCVPACKDSKDKDCLSDCMSGKCGADFFNCMDDGKGGDKGCTHVLTCGQSCDADPSKEFSCNAACYNAMSAAGKTQLKAFMGCMSTKKEEECIAETLTCVSEGKSGTKKCGEHLDCAEKCADVKGDLAQLVCTGKCLQDVDAKEHTLYVGAVACGADFDEGCGDVMAQCIAPTGTDTCKVIVGCAAACKDDDDACVAGCFAKGSKSEAALAFEVALGCDNDQPNCGASWLTCMQPDGKNSCAASAKCVSDCDGNSDEATCIMTCLGEVKKASVDLLKPVLTCAAKDDTTSTECKGALGKCLADQ